MSQPTLDQQIDAQKQRVDDIIRRLGDIFEEFREAMSQMTRISILAAAEDPDSAKEIAELVVELQRAIDKLPRAEDIIRRFIR